MLAHVAVERGPQAGRSFDVRPGPPFLLGSGPGVQARLDGAAARHAALLLDAAGLKVVDLAGGATLDGAALVLRRPTPVGTGQAIELAGSLLRVELDGVPEPAPAPATDEGPPRVTGFEVLAVLGEGGLGRVLRARRLADGAEVALKLLHESIVPGSPDHQRFLREGRVGQRLRSPHLVATLDALVDEGGRAVLVLELVRGPSLQALLARHGPLTVAAALRTGEHVALALAAAHAAGVVHRDVKPANILFAPDGAAKLGDLGLAKDLQGTLRSLTRSGVGLGTLGYMAPEQLTDARRVAAPADLYGLGATLFHALAGRVPIEVARPEEVGRIVTDAPAPLRALRPEVPPAVEALVHALLAKDPLARPGGAAEVALRLRALAS